MSLPAIKPPWWERNEYNPLTQEEHQDKIKRVWHHYSLWEDAKAGMYRTIAGVERKAYLKKAIEFTGDNGKYGNYMQKVIVRWPIASEHNLTAMCVNRRAWVGHAACCMAIGCPEDITREAWGHLSANQRKLANAQADIAIRQWEEQYRRGGNAKDTIRNECFGGGERAHINNFRPIQQSILELLGREGLNGNASPCGR